MKKLIFLIVFIHIAMSVVSAQAMFFPDEIYVSGETWVTPEYYSNGEGNVTAGLYLSVERLTSSLGYVKIALQSQYGSMRRSGVDVFARNGERTIFSLSEMYVDTDYLRIGKQLFTDEEGVKFDFISFNPFESRDLSRPFSALDDNRVLGDWGITASFMGGQLKLIAKLAEPPIISMDEDDPWTRPLPSGLGYGDVKTEVDYSVGLRWGDDIAYMKYDIYLQHGAGNFPVDININNFGGVRPVIAEQTAISAVIQKPFEGWSARLGAAWYSQSGYSDFVVGEVELEKLWENLFQSGDVFFLDVGFSDVWETESGSGIPELDLRQVYEGMTALVAMEYSFDDWSLKIKGAYNFNHKGGYLAPEIVWSLTDSVELSLKHEMIDGKSSVPPSSAADNPWSQYSDCDRVMGLFRFYF